MAIEVDGLCKNYGKHKAISQLTFRVATGEIFGFLGPNGSGKTTTVRMLCGLLRPDSGQARIGGTSVVDNPQRVKADLGVLPDGSALFPHLTLLEHLIMEARMRGLERNEAEVRARDLLLYTQLWDKRNLKVSQCSVGMCKKLGIILALIHKPPVVVLDEPFEGLDPVSARRIRNLLQTMVSRCGTTLFITSHMLTLVEDLVHRVGIISEGRLIREADVRDLKDSGDALLDVYLASFGEDDRDADFAWLN